MGIESITFKAGDAEPVTFTRDDVDAMRGLADRLRSQSSTRSGSSPHRVAHAEGDTALICPSFLSDFREWPPLRRLGEELIARHPEFAAIKKHEPVVRYLWKRKGGASGGNQRLGKLVKVSGLTEFFGVCDYVVWLARDHAMLMEMTDLQVEALLYHELLHIEPQFDDDGEFDGWGTKGHDTELFYDELKRYGFWRDGLQVLGGVVRSLRLPGFEEEEAPGPGQHAEVVDRLGALETTLTEAGVGVLANELAWVRRRLQYGSAEASRIEEEMDR